jgi:hypothetical protein
VIAVEPGEGAEGVVRDPTFRVALDRALAPLQPVGSVVIASGARRFPLSIASDPVTRTLEVSARSLPPNAAFRLELSLLTDLDAGVMEAPMTVHFATGDRMSDPRPVVGWSAARVVLDRCAPCHDGASAALGLDLASSDGVLRTAIGVPAREVASGVSAGLRGLVRIEPGSPSLSYLVWKLSGDEHVPGGMRPEHDGIAVEDAAVLVGWIRAGAPLEEPE